MLEESTLYYEFSRAAEPQLTRLAALSLELADRAEAEKERNPGIDIWQSAEMQTMHVMNNGRTALMHAQYGDFATASAGIARSIERLDKEGFEAQLSLREKPSDLLRQIKTHLDEHIVGPPAPSR